MPKTYWQLTREERKRADRARRNLARIEENRRTIEQIAKNRAAFQEYFDELIESVECQTGATLHREAWRDRAHIRWLLGHSAWNVAHNWALEICAGE